VFLIVMLRKMHAIVTTDVLQSHGMLRILIDLSNRYHGNQTVRLLLPFYLLMSCDAAPCVVCDSVTTCLTVIAPSDHLFDCHRTV
jgi:hypothetical protein